MDFTKYESTAFANANHMWMVLRRKLGLDSLHPVIVMGEKSFLDFQTWEDELAPVTKNSNGVVGMLSGPSGRIPVVVQGNGGMEIVLLPKQSEEFQYIETAMPDEEPVEPEIGEDVLENIKPVEVETFADPEETPVEAPAKKKSSKKKTAE